MPDSTPSSARPFGSRRARFLAVALAATVIVVLALAWLVDPFVTATSAPPAVDPANAVASPLAVDPSKHTPTPPEAADEASERRLVDPLPNDRARLRGRVLFGTTPAAEATVRGGDASTTTTAADGTFVLEVPAGLVKLSIAVAGTRRATPAGLLRLVAGQTFELGDLVVPRQPALRGRVTDEQGDPIADATVLLAPTAGSLAEHILGRASPEFRPDGITDRDGRFRIDAPRSPSGSVQIERRGYQHAEKQIEPTSEGEQDLGTIVMRASPALRGIVHGPHGRPEAGARIVVGGAPYEPLRPYETATTDEHGAFQLDPRYGSHFTVFADGCEPKVVKHEGDTLVHVTMSPAHALHGVVANSQGQPGVVRITPPPGDYAERHGWLQEALATAWPIAADGTFTIPCLPEGSWQCGIEVPGVGRSALVVVDIPCAAPVAFELLPRRTVQLVVTDDLGAPVPHVAVRCTSKLPGAGKYRHCVEDLRLDAKGRADLLVVNGHEPQLALMHPLHAPAGRQVGRDEVAITMVLPRLGFVVGTVRATKDQLGRCRLAVQANAANGTHAGTSDVDENGSYRLALAAGNYQLVLIAGDASSLGGHDRPITNPLPLVSEFEALAPAVAVSVQPGTTTTVDFTAPAFAEITGRVLAGGKPLANAIVLASFEQTAQLGLRIPEPDEFDVGRHTFFPHQRTDHNGSFRFAISSAREVRLSARHGGVGLWSAPVSVAIGNGERRHVDLVLAAATIRGKVDLSQVPRHQRTFVAAQLWPSKLAKQPTPEYLSLDSFWFQAPVYFLPRCELDDDGNFAFECLPPGDYVVRIGNLIGRPILQHAVTTTGDEVHELGLLTPAVHHAVRVPTDLPANSLHRVHVLTEAEGNGSGAFVCLGTVRDSVLELDLLPAGSYQLYLVPSHPGEAATEPTTEQAVSITIGADGSVTPDVVRFTAPK